MRWKLFTLCSAVSLLLSVAVCVLWVRSYRVRPQEQEFKAAGTKWRAASGDGRLWIDDLPAVLDELHFRQRGLDRAYADLDRLWDDLKARGRLEAGLRASEPDSRDFGPELDGAEDRVRRLERVMPPAVRRLVSIPHGLAAVVCAAPMAIMLARRAGFRLRIRFRAGRCPACGYDLRATPDRCPECGREPAAA
jgi:hypothetical protein